jgi:RNA polymerase sigma factor (sigma-70 family)
MSRTMLSLLKRRRNITDCKVPARVDGSVPLSVCSKCGPRAGNTERGRAVFFEKWSKYAHWLNECRIGTSYESRCSVIPSIVLDFVRADGTYLTAFGQSFDESPAFLRETSTTMSSASHNQSHLTAWAPEITSAAGDPAAPWRSLEACRDYLRLVVRRGGWSKRPNDANTSDLIQHTILEWWRGFDRFRGRSPIQLRAWLRAILLHALLRSRRRQDALWREPGSAVELVLGTTTSPSNAAQKNDSRAVLDAALAVLSERHRSVIHLRVWEQLSVAQIGARPAITEDAARIVFGRALASLREMMRPGHDPG